MSRDLPNPSFPVSFSPGLPFSFFKVTAFFTEKINPVILAVGMIMMAFMANSAWAHPDQFHHGGMGNGQFHPRHFGDGHFHHHHHGAIILAPPLLSYYPPPIYYSPPIVVQGAPTTFVGQGADGTTYNYWSYCANPPGFYPQIQQCLSEWQAIPVTPSE